MDISKQKVSVSCPECNQSIKVSIKQIYDEQLVKCHCGQGIQLKDSKGSNKKVVRDINKAFKDLERTFKGFGR